MPAEPTTTYGDAWGYALRRFPDDKPPSTDALPKSHAESFDGLRTITGQDATGSIEKQPVTATPYVTSPSTPPAVRPRSSKHSGPSDLLLVVGLVLILVIGIVAKTDLLWTLHRRLRPARRRGFEVVLTRPRRPPRVRPNAGV